MIEIKRNEFHYEVYQIPISNKAKFRSFDEFKDEIKMIDYVFVYEGSIFVTDKVANNEHRKEFILDDIFYMLNAKRPKDYYAHSLSCSDVIKLEDDYYYCDFIGWEKLNKERFLR